MKKLACTVAVLVMALLLAVCGNDAGTAASVPSASPGSDSTQNRSDSGTTNGAANDAAANDAAANDAAGSSGSVGQTGDVDLTALSSTMIYAEVYNMMVTPDDYIGRTIKMSGQFAVYAQTESGPYYYACVIADATACCQQGIEFVLADESLTYPADYPELGATITVTGVFQTYEENGDLYCHLVDAYFD